MKKSSQEETPSQPVSGKKMNPVWFIWRLLYPVLIHYGVSVVVIISFFTYFTWNMNRSSMIENPLVIQEKVLNSTLLQLMLTSVVGGAICFWFYRKDQLQRKEGTLGKGADFVWSPPVVWFSVIVLAVAGSQLLNDLITIFHLNDMHLNDIPASFNQGAADLLGAAMCIGMAQGIIIILGGTDASSGTVLNTILHSISGAMQDLPPVVSAWFMYVFQSVFNFFVVSGSGQAALTMPIMAPLADLVGVERQIAVLAFQLGDAFTNFIVPTSGCLLGALAAAKLEWGSWAKFQIKFQAVLVVFASLAVVLGVVIGLS